MATRKVNVTGDTKFPFSIWSWEVYLLVKDTLNRYIVAIPESRAVRKGTAFVFPFTEPGWLCVYNGTDNAYAYWRSEKYEEWLGQQKIDKIEMLQNNSFYQRIHQEFDGNNKSVTHYVTDGRIEIQKETLSEEEKKRQASWGNCCFDFFENITIQDATWIIEESWSNNGLHRALLTSEKKKKVLKKNFPTPGTFEMGHRGKEVVELPSISPPEPIPNMGRY